MKTDPHPHHVPALPPDLRLSALRRRLGLSPSVARACVEHAFGDSQRGDLAHLASLTAARCSSAEARS